MFESRWHDVTSERMKNVTYVNTTDKPIYVSILAEAGIDVGTRRYHPGCEYSYNGDFIKWYECREIKDKPMFELDEEIEVSSYKDFYPVKKIKFKHQDPNGGAYHGLDEDGFMCYVTYARKIEPKVQITMSCDNGIVIRLIPKELADKIKAGDV